jgi:4-hydroxy-2-oxoheptanedioate aldolase
MALHLRERLHDGNLFLFSWMGIPGSQLAGQLARAGLDGVCLDLQHGLIGMDQANGMADAINAAGKPCITRVLWNDPGLIGQALDFGSAIVIAPMINTVEHAKALVKAAKYPPMGQRSWGGYAMVQASGKSPAEYLKEANRDTMVFAMVETQEALDIVDEIAAVPGLDGLFVGPSDLSIALSKGAELNRLSAANLVAMKKIVETAKKHKLVAGAFAGTPEIIKSYSAMGYTFMAAVTDNDVLKLGVSAAAGSLSLKTGS